jgi:hypothetical protein
MSLARRLWIAVLAFGGPPAALAVDLPTLIARVAPAVAVISGEDGGRGSAFVVSREGLIVTNLHVVAPLKQPRVTLADGRAFDAVAVVGYDSDRDLALLKVSGKGLPTLSLGASANVRVGQRVVAFGAPWGLSGTATNGIVSAIRLHHRVSGATVLQTDAAINPGNSGGPLVNTEGQVVGVVVSTIPRAQSLGFAVPVDDLRALIRSSGYGPGSGSAKGCGTSSRCEPKRGPALTVDELRRRLLHTQWGPSLLARRWRADGDFYAVTASAAVFELDGNETSIQLTQLRPATEAWLGRKLVLSLARGENGFEGESSGEVQCETVRESRRLAWKQPQAQITALALDQIELAFFAPAPPDPQGSCELEFRPYRVTLTPAGATEAIPTTGEDGRVESIRAMRIAYLQRHDRLRRDCPEIRAKLERDCVQRTPWNATSCMNFDDLAAVCSREGL